MNRPKSNVFDMNSKRLESREEALERLFRDHGAALHGFLKVRLGINQDMEDVVQEVFAKLARMDDLAERLSPANQSARSFIFTVANNLALDMERSKTVRRKYLETLQQATVFEDAVSEDSPEALALASQELEAIKEVIVNLRPVWRRAFILNRFKYMSFPEIAVEMNISVKTVEKYMKKSLIQIRKAAANIAGAD